MVRVVFAVVTVAVVALVALALILLLVYRLKPEKLKLRATVTRWATFDLEMTSPNRDPDGS